MASIHFFSLRANVSVVIYKFESSESFESSNLIIKL